MLILQFIFLPNWRMAKFFFWNEVFCITYNSFSWQKIYSVMSYKGLTPSMVHWQSLGTQDIPSCLLTCSRPHENFVNCFRINHSSKKIANSYNQTKTRNLTSTDLVFINMCNVRLTGAIHFITEWFQFTTKTFTSSLLLICWH